MTEVQAREVIETAMKVLFYRDARSLNKVRSLYSFLSLFLRSFGLRNES